MQGVPGVVFCSTQEQKCHSSGQRPQAHSVTEVLCVVFTAVLSGQRKWLVFAWLNHQHKQGGIFNTLPV